MPTIYEQIEEMMNSHLREGSKNSRREEVRKLKYLAKWLLENQHHVVRVENIAKKHIWEFYEFLEDSGKSRSYINKFSLAIEKLWFRIGNTGKSPSPRF